MHTGTSIIEHKANISEIPNWNSYVLLYSHYQKHPEIKKQYEKYLHVYGNIIPLSAIIEYLKYMKIICIAICDYLMELEY